MKRHGHKPGGSSSSNQRVPSNNQPSFGRKKAIPIGYSDTEDKNRSGEASEKDLIQPKRRGGARESRPPPTTARLIPSKGVPKSFNIISSHDAEKSSSPEILQVTRRNGTQNPSAQSNQNQSTPIRQTLGAEIRDAYRIFALSDGEDTDYELTPISRVKYLVHEYMKNDPENKATYEVAYMRIRKEDPRRLSESSLPKRAYHTLFQNSRVPEKVEGQQIMKTPSRPNGVHTARPSDQPLTLVPKRFQVDTKKKRPLTPSAPPRQTTIKKARGHQPFSSWSSSEDDKCPPSKTLITSQPSITLPDSLSSRNTQGNTVKATGGTLNNSRLQHRPSPNNSQPVPDKQRAEFSTLVNARAEKAVSKPESLTKKLTTATKPQPAVRQPTLPSSPGGHSQKFKDLLDLVSPTIRKHSGKLKKSTAATGYVPHAHGIIQSTAAGSVGVRPSPTDSCLPNTYISPQLKSDPHETIETNNQATRSVNPTSPSKKIFSPPAKASSLVPTQNSSGHGTSPNGPSKTASDICPSTSNLDSTPPNVPITLKKTLGSSAKNEMVEHTSQTPYFEYSILKKVWSEGQLEKDVEAVEIGGSHFSYNEHANREAEKLFKIETEQLQQTSPIRCQESFSKRDENDCIICIKTFSPLHLPLQKSYLKIWVDRMHVSAIEAKAQPPGGHTPYIAKTLWAVRLFRLIDNPDAPREGIKNEKMTEEDPNVESSSEESEPESDTDPDKGKHAKKARLKAIARASSSSPTNEIEKIAKPKEPVSRTLRVHASYPSSHPELFTTIQLANTAACHLEWEVTHPIDSDNVYDIHFRKKHQAELNEMLYNMDIGEHKPWNVIFTKMQVGGRGGEKYEIVVEKVEVVGPRNV